MSSKVTPKSCKIYKPEVLICPKCSSPIKYRYTVSNKVVQFSSGKVLRIKNLGYSCLNCNDDNIYFSQTANKLCFKGYTYSAKIVCMIDYYKNKHLGREGICDILASKGVEISDRNIDIIYKRFKEIYYNDHDIAIKESYEMMLEKYKEIRISLDFITISDMIYTILYDAFSGKIIGLWKFNTINDSSLIETLTKYIKNYTKVTYIYTIRSGTRIYPIVKQIAPVGASIVSYTKF